MHVTALSLTDFRCYAQVDLDLRPGVTSLVGQNGQGKTNLVEAVGYVATLGSHRVATDAPLVRLGAERAVVRAKVARDDRDTIVELEINPGRANRARINRSPVPRPREVLGLLRTVLFAPEDLALVKGDPSERRRFLDDLLVARTPRMAGVRADYDRVLKQRNALLKSASAARRGGRGSDDVLSTLEVWDTHLATLGGEILAARLDLVAALEPLVATAYDTVSSGAGPAALEYVSSLGARGRARARPHGAGRGSCSRASSGGAATSSTAASRSSGRTATTCCCASVPRRRRGTPRTASRGRTRWRCGSRRTTCCAATARPGASRC